MHLSSKVDLFDNAEDEDVKTASKYKGQLYFCDAYDTFSTSRS